MEKYKTYDLFINDVYNSTLEGLTDNDLNERCKIIGNRLHRHIDGDYYITWIKTSKEDIRFLLAISYDMRAELMSNNKFALFYEMTHLAICNFLMKNILY